MKDSVFNIFKSIGLILLVLFFSSLMFGIFNLNPNGMSQTMYLVYMSIFDFILLGIYFCIYRRDLIRDFKSYFKDFGKNFETSFKYWLVGFIIMVVTNIIIVFGLGRSIANMKKLLEVILMLLLYLWFFVLVYMLQLLKKLLLGRVLERLLIINGYMFLLVDLFLVFFILLVLFLVFMICYI